MSRLTLGAVMATLLAALLACGGGSKDDCKAEITRDGKMASGKGEDRLRLGTPPAGLGARPTTRSPPTTTCSPSVPAAVAVT